MPGSQIYLVWHIYLCIYIKLHEFLLKFYKAIRTNIFNEKFINFDRNHFLLVIPIPQILKFFLVLFWFFFFSKFLRISQYVLDYNNNPKYYEKSSLGAINHFTRSFPPMKPSSHFPLENLFTNSALICKTSSRIKHTHPFITRDQLQKSVFLPHSGFSQQPGSAGWNSRLQATTLCVSASPSRNEAQSTVPPQWPMWAQRRFCFYWIYYTAWRYSHMWNVALNTFWIFPIKDQIQSIHENNL